MSIATTISSAAAVLEKYASIRIWLALGKKPGEQIRAQVFQNAICNWRCWYCFVDFKLLAGDKKHADFLTCDEMLDLYLNQENPPEMIELNRKEGERILVFLAT